MAAAGFIKQNQDILFYELNYDEILKGGFLYM